MLASHFLPDHSCSPPTHCTTTLTPLSLKSACLKPAVLHRFKMNLAMSTWKTCVRTADGGNHWQIDVEKNTFRHKNSLHVKVMLWLPDYTAFKVPAFQLDDSGWVLDYNEWKLSLSSLCSCLCSPLFSRLYLAFMNNFNFRHINIG